jgi:hypothetical protein
MIFLEYSLMEDGQLNFISKDSEKEYFENIVGKN